MAKKFVLVFGPVARNFGGPCVLVSTRRVLSDRFPGAEFTLIAAEAKPEIQKRNSERYDIAIVSPLETRAFYPRLFLTALLRRLTGRLWGSRAARDLVRAIAEADALIDMYGIAFADSLGLPTFIGRAREGVFYVIAKVLGKPVVKYTADLGPFEERWNRFFARLYLNRFVDLIITRGDDSRQRALDIGVKTKMVTCPDTAFLFEPAESDISKRLAGYRRAGPVIGFAASFQARNRAASPEEYLRARTDLVRHIIGKLGARVALIPNEIWDGPNDDLSLAEQVCAAVADERCEVIHTEDMTGQEIKGVIRECDAVVSARYHTIVAALSMGIPTLAVSWHHKYHDVLQLFGQEQWRLDAASVKAEELISKFDALWSLREQLGRQIVEARPAVREAVHKGAEAVEELLREKRR